MSNPLFQQLQNSNINAGAPNLLKQFLDFKNTFTGNPQQIIQSMINSGRISQTQLNQLSQQATELYKQIYGNK